MFEREGRNLVPKKYQTPHPLDDGLPVPDDLPF